jgi:tetratricopeptide (TPR) repeat protein
MADENKTKSNKDEEKSNEIDIESINGLKELIDSKIGVELNPEEMIYIYNLGAKKCEIGDFENAIPIFQFLLFKDMKNTLYMKSMGGCFQNLERFDEALLCYQSSYILDKKANSDCLFYMGYCALKLKKNEQALEFLTKFCETNPDHELVKKAKLFMNGLSQDKK